MPPPEPPVRAPLPPEQQLLFQRVLRALTRAGMGYAVAGAFAFEQYTGISRPAKDLDLFLPAEKMELALTLCRTAGLSTELTDPVWLGKAWAGEYFVDLISGMSNGVFWVTPEWIRHSRRGKVLDQPAALLAPEEMILSKIFVVRRERFDGSDICHLVYCCGARLDWKRLLAAVGEHWEMLLWHLQLFRYVYPRAQAAVPAGVWRELQGRTAAAGGPAFRGSLVDPHMFAPDMEQWGMENLEQQFRRRRLKNEAA